MKPKRSNPLGFTGADVFIVVLLLIALAVGIKLTEDDTANVESAAQEQIDQGKRKVEKVEKEKVGPLIDKTNVIYRMLDAKPGRPGLQGPVGGTGARGVQGPLGPEGGLGDVGPSGTDGVPGQPGAGGAPGEPGAQGQAGAPGEQGAEGPQGPPGPPPDLTGWTLTNCPNPLFVEGCTLTPPP